MSGTAAAPPEPRQGGHVRLEAGDPAPWFHAACTSNPRFALDTAAGRYIVLGFLGTASDAEGAAALGAVIAGRRVFDDVHACFFGVSVDPADQAEGRMRESLPGIRFFWDFDGAVSRAYGAVAQDAAPGTPMFYRRHWIVLDPTLRVLRVVPFEPGADGVAALLSLVAGLPPPSRFAGPALQAPVLFLPDVFEPALCRELIEAYERDGGEESGAMVERDGKTVVQLDPAHKRRRDFLVEDPALVRQTHQRIQRRVVPEIAKVHQFHVTRIERTIVGCYTAEDGGHFRAHRDNTTKGTAHRRFAVSINLNADFDGGEVSFPEYGPQSFRPPPGGAVVFSCSLLHAVSRVTRGRRYAFLPFLYDEAAARLRLENNRFLDPSLGAYRGA